MGADRPLTAFGETKSLAAWSRDPRCVVLYNTLVSRLYNKWLPEDAISAPPDTRRQRNGPQIRREEDAPEICVGGRELCMAGREVLDGLNARIDAAPSTAKPVFAGIAKLHDATLRFESLYGFEQASQTS